MCKLPNRLCRGCRDYKSIGRKCVTDARLVTKRRCLALICVGYPLAGAMRLLLSSGAESEPIDVHVSRPGGDKENRIGHIGRAQHPSTRDKSGPLIRVEWVPGRGIGGAGRYQTQPNAGTPVFGRQRLMQAPKTVLACRIRRVLWKADVIGDA